MLEVHRKASPSFQAEIVDTIVLDHVQREKGRLKVISSNGQEVGLFLERGKLLHRGDVLRTDCNKYLRVELAKEPVITASAKCWEAFSRACYHLGNRHVRLQLGEMWLRFQEDPVLVELVEHLGLTAQREMAEFEPESGAYGHGHAGKAGHHAHN
ncbi:MAG: urease accessory protein UreE [Pseudomonadales bacterium]